MPEELISGTRTTDIEPATLQSSTRTIKRRLSDSALITDISETGRSDSKTTYKNLRKKSTEIQLRTLARISGEVSKALNLYQGFTNSGWEPVAETDRATRALVEWFEEMADLGVNVNNLINENIYDLYVIGAMCMRILLINDEPKLIRNIPPEEIDFLHQLDPDPMNMDYGKIWYTGFYLQRDKREFVVLESILDPNPYFYYAPMLTTSKSPKGISIIESVIELAISAGEKNYMMTEYLRGNIFPQEIVSLVLDEYFKVLLDEDVDFDMKNFNKTKDDAVKAVTDFFDTSDSTQTLVSDVPLQKIVVGTLEGNNLRGLPEVNDAHESAFPRALKAPAPLLGIRRQGNALNDTETKYAIRSFYKNILNIRATTKKGWEKLCRSYLSYKGITGKGGIAFTETDIELKQAITEAVVKETEAAGNLIRDRIFTRGEMRKNFTQGTLDLTQHDEALPEELMDEPEPEPMDGPTDDSEAQGEA